VPPQVQKTPVLILYLFLLSGSIDIQEPLLWIIEVYGTDERDPIEDKRAAGGNRDNKFLSEGLFLALAQDFSNNRINTAIILRGP
jgi:hypothetical protein